MDLKKSPLEYLSRLTRAHIDNVHWYSITIPELDFAFHIMLMYM